MKPSILVSFFPALAAAYIGGPCDDIWQKNHACICLKTKECREKWDGTVIQGDPGAWSCPDDPKDVKGCIVDHCDGLFTGCRWTSHCKHLGRSECAPRGHGCRLTVSLRIPENLCPGGNGFRCCFLDP